MKKKMIKTKKFLSVLAALSLIFTACGSSKAVGKEEAQITGTVEAEETGTEDAEKTEVSREAAESYYLVSEDLIITSRRDGSGGTLHYDYEYDENQRLISVKSGERYVRVLSYDENGNLISDVTTSTRSDGSQSVLEIVYSYDEQNRMLSYQKSLDGRLQEMEQRGYREDSYSVLTSDGISVYNYEDLLIEEYRLTESPDPVLLASYSYDEKGNVIRYDGANGSYVECTNTYDEAGNLLQAFRESFYASGKEPAYDEIFDYSYDKSGNLLELKNYHKIRANGQEELISLFEYEYDSEGNIIYSKSAQDGVITESWYEYDAFGNQTYRKIQTDTQIMEYYSSYEKR